jgi:enoyl-CoA hydratase/carnithine racemase
MISNAVLYEKKQNVGIITFSRPDQLNAINKDLLHGLIQTLEAAGQDVDMLWETGVNLPCAVTSGY